MRGIFPPMPPVELDELELPAEPVEEEEDDDEDDEDDEEELEPEHPCAAALGPLILMESILAKPSELTPASTKRFCPAFSDISTVSSAQVGQPPVGAKSNITALPALPLAVKVPERGTVAPLA